MKCGFTLIELLVVIAIIAILAAILYPVFAQVQAKLWENRKDGIKAGEIEPTAKDLEKMANEEVTIDHGSKIRILLHMSDGTVIDANVPIPMDKNVVDVELAEENGDVYGIDY